jgi:acyl-CoA reductase-like NAD-dependent aldehyde dehydrogenase
MVEITEYKMLINGTWSKSSDGNSFDSINPSSGKAWSTIPAATEKDVNMAVESAHAAFTKGPWSKMTPTERGQCLKNLANLLSEHSETLGKIESIDTGKMLKETRWQAKYISQFFDFFAGCADKVNGETLPIDKPDLFVFTNREHL